MRHVRHVRCPEHRTEGVFPSVLAWEGSTPESKCLAYHTSRDPEPNKSILEELRRADRWNKGRAERQFPGTSHLSPAGGLVGPGEHLPLAFSCRSHRSELRETRSVCFLRLQAFTANTCLREAQCNADTFFFSSFTFRSQQNNSCSSWTKG